MKRHPLTSALAVAVLALAMTAAPALGALAGIAGAPPVSQLSSDPFTNATSQHATEVEPSSFAWGSTIVDAVQAGRFTDGGASDIGWATSADGGATWTHGFLAGLTVHRGGGRYPRATDPVVSYDAKHKTWLIAATALVFVTGREPPGIGVAVLRSANGTSWTKPVFAIGGTSDAPNYDKDWIACDNTASSPHYGTCYAVVDMHAQTNQLAIATSTDGGALWSTPVDPAGATRGLPGGMVVQPDGTVVVVYNTVSGASTEVALSSADGGQTWSAPVTIAAVQHHRPDGNLRGDPLPSVAVDQAGTVYVAWADCRFRTGCPANDIVFSTSADGTTWTAPARIPIDPVTSSVEHYLPVIAAVPGSAGHLALYYYFYPKASCTQTTCMIGAGFSSSVDGGAAWSAGQQLVAPFALSLLPDTTKGRMVGDYIGAAITGSGTAHGTLIIARKPTGGTAFNVALYTDGGQSITGGPNRASAPAGTVAASPPPGVVPPIERIGPDLTNSHWSGYDAMTGHFTAVGATWVQPSVNCSQGGDVVFWTGLGGGTTTSNSLQQNGTFAQCEGGTAVYEAWWETWPCNAITQYGGTVKPGDTITATTVNEGSNQYKLSVSDPTEGWSVSPTKTGCNGGSTQTAEVVTETPEVGGGLASLPNFGKVTYTGATINNAPLASASPTKINMARNGVIMSKTTAITGGNSFSNIWKHNS